MTKTILTCSFGLIALSGTAFAADLGACDPMIMGNGKSGDTCHSDAGVVWRVEDEFYFDRRVFRDMKSGMKVTAPLAGTTSYPKAAGRCYNGYHLPSGYPHELNGKSGFPDRDSDFVTLANDGMAWAIRGTYEYPIWSNSIFPGDAGKTFMFEGEDVPPIFSEETRGNALSICISDEPSPEAPIPPAPSGPRPPVCDSTPVDMYGSHTAFSADARVAELRLLDPAVVLAGARQLFMGNSCSIELKSVQRHDRTIAPQDLKFTGVNVQASYTSSILRGRYVDHYTMTILLNDPTFSEIQCVAHTSTAHLYDTPVLAVGDLKEDAEDDMNGDFVPGAPQPQALIRLQWQAEIAACRGR